MVGKRRCGNIDHMSPPVRENTEYEYVYKDFDFLLDSDVLDEKEKERFRAVSADMEDNEVTFALKALSEYLYRFYQRNQKIGVCI